MSSNIYSSGEYLRNNPTLDIEDSPWKISKIIPLLDEVIRVSSHKGIKILDIGGGAGLILRGISDYLGERGIRVEKYTLDLSEEMLLIQRENNPDVKITMLGDISRGTTFSRKEITLTLLIDVLEHIPDADSALKELSRISEYAILKVPIENNIYYNILNFIKGGELRKDIFKKVGHVNFYNFREFEKQVYAHAGEILDYRFMNVFEYYLSKDYHRKISAVEKVLYALSRLAFSISPSMCSRIFTDFVVCLIKCR